MPLARGHIGAMLQRTFSMLVTEMVRAWVAWLCAVRDCGVQVCMHKCQDILAKLHLVDAAESAALRLEPNPPAPFTLAHRRVRAAHRRTYSHTHACTASMQHTGTGTGQQV